MRERCTIAKKEARKNKETITEELLIIATIRDLSCIYGRISVQLRENSPLTGHFPGGHVLLVGGS
jgi:hypothetical protein